MTEEKKEQVKKTVGTVAIIGVMVCGAVAAFVGVGVDNALATGTGFGALATGVVKFIADLIKK